MAEPLVRPARAVSLITAVAAALLMALAPIASEALRPSQRTADLRGPIDLAAQVPGSFGEWQEDKSIVPILPDPQLQATLDATYTQVLARTYVNARRERVMLSIAYGNDQSSEATAVHRPDFCYRAQGFAVSDAGLARIDLEGRSLTVQRLLSRMGQREEPISYWVTLDQKALLPGLTRKLAQLQYGLQGRIADGMVIRVSSLSSAPDQAFALQARFLGELHASLAPRLRPRYFGA